MRLKTLSLFITILTATALIAFTPQASARVVIDGYGTISHTYGAVLSSEDSGSGDNSGSGSGSDNQEESKEGEQSEAEKKAEENAAEETKKASEEAREKAKESETESKNGTKTKVKKEDDGRVKTEIRLQDGTKIKTETGTKRTRTDIYSGATKVRIERVGDRVRIKTENEAGEETEVEGDEQEVETDAEGTEVKGTLVKTDGKFQITRGGVTYTLTPAAGMDLDTLVGQPVEVKGTGIDGSTTELVLTKAKAETEDEVIIEPRADTEQVKIRALQNKAIIERLNVQALTDLPIAVDINTNVLTVTTPQGEKRVTVLPDEAIKNILAANVIDSIGTANLVEQVRTGNIETLGQVIELGLKSDVPTYAIQGIKNHKLFGFFPITTQVQVEVSAETGEVVDTNQSFLDTVVDVFSTTQ